MFSLQYVNGVASCVLSAGKSAILWVPSLPLSLQHTPAHLKIMPLQTEFPFITQKPEFFKQFKVIPLPT